MDGMSSPFGSLIILCWVNFLARCSAGGVSNLAFFGGFGLSSSFGPSEAWETAGAGRGCNGAPSGGSPLLAAVVPAGGRADALG